MIVAARGLAVRGRLWRPDAPAIDDATVVVAADGTIAQLGPSDQVDCGDLPVTTAAWVGPGLVDAHVHLAFGAPETELAGGLVAVRDLGAPLSCAREWRTPVATPGSPAVAVAGPLLTAPGGYPSRSWGADGFAGFVDSPSRARQAVRDLYAGGVQLIKLAIESSGGRLPVLGQPEATAIVAAAHEVGLPVTAHALTVDAVRTALAAGVDELCHAPLEELPGDLVDAIAASGVPVVSTLVCLTLDGDQRPLHNARALHEAGVRLVYGTDLGNAGTRPGVDPRELALLVQAGAGLEQVLRGAATASPAGLDEQPRMAVGEPARLVLLDADPLQDLGAWARPLRVVVGTAVT